VKTIELEGIDGNGWTLCQKLSNNETKGFVPSNYIQILENYVEPQHQQKPHNLRIRTKRKPSIELLQRSKVQSLHKLVLVRRPSFGAEQQVSSPTVHQEYHLAINKYNEEDFIAKSPPENIINEEVITEEWTEIEELKLPEIFPDEHYEEDEESIEFIWTTNLLYEKPTTFYNPIFYKTTTKDWFNHIFNVKDFDESEV